MVFSLAISLSEDITFVSSICDLSGAMNCAVLQEGSDIPVGEKLVVRSARGLQAHADKCPRQWVNNWTVQCFPGPFRVSV